MLQFLPGQWVDAFLPDLARAGGFTITSPPSKARPTADRPGYIELAVQRPADDSDHSAATGSAQNPAAWLWSPSQDDILGAEARVRVGGSFVFPPPGVPVFQLRRMVFVAGGVGINPLMSMLSHLAEQRDALRYEVRFLYSMRDSLDEEGERSADRMLFVERLATLFGRGKIKGQLKLFLTPAEKDDQSAKGSEEGVVSCNEVDVAYVARRITAADLQDAVGQDKRFAVAYVCGVPTMTDEFVGVLTSPDGVGMERHRVLYEKWW